MNAHFVLIVRMRWIWFVQTAVVSWYDGRNEKHKAMETLKQIVLATGLLAFAGIVALAQPPVVTVRTDQTWHTTSVDNAYMNKQIAKAAEKYKEYAPIPRIAFYDIAYPKDKSEFVQLNGHGLMLISTSTQDQNELPLKRVYIVSDGAEIELKVLERTFIKEADPASRIAKTFSLFREDSIFIFPIYLNSQSAELKIDFAKNRNGMKVAAFDGKLPPELSGLNGRKPDEGKSFDAPLVVLMKREYPGYFKH